MSITRYSWVKQVFTFTLGFFRSKSAWIKELNSNYGRRYRDHQFVYIKTDVKLLNQSACVLLWIKIHNGSAANKRTLLCYNYRLPGHFTSDNRKVNCQLWFPKYVHCTVLVCKADVHVHFLLEGINICTFFRRQSTWIEGLVSSYDAWYHDAEFDHIQTDVKLRKQLACV